MSSENPDSFSSPENEIHFSPDADSEVRFEPSEELDHWLNMLDLEVVFEPYPSEDDAA